MLTNVIATSCFYVLHPLLLLHPPTPCVTHFKPNIMGVESPSHSNVIDTANARRQSPLHQKTHHLQETECRGPARRKARRKLCKNMNTRIPWACVQTGFCHFAEVACKLAVQSQASCLTLLILSFLISYKVVKMEQNHEHTHQ